MTQRRLGWRVALLAAVCLIPHLGTAAAVTVSSADSFLAALAAAASPGAPNDTNIEISGDIALGGAAVPSTPYEISAGRTVTVEPSPGAGDGSQLLKLDLGLLTKLLYFREGTRLTLRRLNISGMADPQLGSWPANVNSPTVAQTMPFWPTVISDPGYTSVIEDSYVTLHPTPLCDPGIGAAQFAGLKQLAENAGSNETELYTNGTTGFFVDWGAPVPVLSAVTRVAVGTVDSWIRNTSLHCQYENVTDVGAAPAAAPSSSSEAAGGGTPGWVWAIVGVGAAAALALAVGALLWRRRRARRLREQQLLVLTASGSDIEKASHSVKLGSDGLASSALASAANSLTLDGNGQGNVPEGPWRSRVGFIDGLQLGGLIGRGGYARVYKGRWKGTMVAVKVVETHLSQDQRLDLRSEPLLSLSLSHPNVLQSYKMCAVKILTDGGEHPALASEQPSPSATCSSGEQRHSGSSGNTGGRVVPHLTDPNCMVEVMPSDAVLEPGMYEMWLVSELADKGTLADAMKAGRFATQADPPGRNLPMILLCLLDVARGLEYLHSCNIMHGDLKPQNVLLRTSGTDRRGFVCKLGDFGLSRMLPETETHVQTGSYGTVTYASPELLKHGRLTKASDVYSFGIMLWELVTGERLYADMHGMTIIVQVTQHGRRPLVPADFPAPLAGLVQRCWAEDPLARPDAAAIVEELIDFSCAFSTAASILRDAAAADRAAASDAAPP